MLYYTVNKPIMNGRVLYRVFKKRIEIIYFPLTGLKAQLVSTLRNQKKKKTAGVNRPVDLKSS